MIVYAILDDPGLAGNFDYASDFTDTERWLWSQRGRKASTARQALRTGYAFWKRESKGQATFEIVTRGLAETPLYPGQVGIRCLVCGLTSYHPDDVGELYCGHCHRFHQDPHEDD